MNPAILAKKGIDYLDRESARLIGYRLHFNKRSLRPLLPRQIGFANLEESQRDIVEGVLYRIAKPTLEILDKVERCPEHYARIQVTVETESGKTSCFTYRAQPDKIAQGLFPSRNYINHILAAKEFLSSKYCEWLDGLETFSGECAICHKVTCVLFHKQEERMFVLCPPCLEAQRIWSDTVGKALSILDTEAIMMHIRRTNKAYTSVSALIDDVVAMGLIDTTKR